jgi:hypothetical protein
MGPRKERLLEKAKASPHNLRFDELCKLAEEFGWVFERQNASSHKIYSNPNLSESNGRMMNFQSKHGKAKLYQVKQLLDAIEQL